MTGLWWLRRLASCTVLLGLNIRYGELFCDFFFSFFCKSCSCWFIVFFFQFCLKEIIINCRFQSLQGSFTQFSGFFTFVNCFRDPAPPPTVSAILRPGSRNAVLLSILASSVTSFSGTTIVFSKNWSSQFRSPPYKSSISYFLMTRTRIRNSVLIVMTLPHPERTAKRGRVSPA